jgi:hypothetical protein
MISGRTELASRLEVGRASIAQAERWIKDGWRMARIDPDGVFEAIELKHDAELATHQVLADQFKTQGQTILARRDELQTTLQAAGFNPAHHLRDIAQGKGDLAWALGLLVLNATLAVFVLLGFGPWYLTVPLALLVLVTALPIEEFFHAYNERAAMREGLFLTLSVLALGAQFWLGTIRGLFLAALFQPDTGPTSAALGAAAVVLQYALGILATVSELVCGYKIHRARTQLLSGTARTVEERDRCTRDLPTLYAVVKRAQAEPDIRRAYRQIGARQHLAWRKTAQQELERGHLRRAVIGAGVALLILAAFLLLTSRAFAETREVRPVVVLFDLTKSVPAPQFQANLETVTNLVERVRERDRFLVIGITGGFGQPQILLDRTLPESGYLGLQLQAGREDMAIKWRAIARQLQPTFQSTDIIGTLTLLTYICKITPSSHLVVLSDLRQSTHALDFENIPYVDSATVIPRLKEARAIPRLAGLKVSLLGVDPSGKSASYFESLRTFWLRFFREAGAEVLMFSVDRQIPEF